MPTLPQQPTLDQKKSLQININSEDDAKAVIQHLQKIKNTYDLLNRTSGIESIEFCIAETMRRNVEGTLTGAVRWCRTYVRSMAPFPGNSHFPLPHFVPQPPQPKKPVPDAPVTAPVPTLVPEPLLNPQPLGKSKRPVPAEAKGV